jgi:hypothetical protein
VDVGDTRGKEHSHWDRVFISDVVPGLPFELMGAGFGGIFMLAVQAKSPQKDDPCANVPVAPPGVDVNKNISEAREQRRHATNTLNVSGEHRWFYNQVKNKGPWDYKQQGKQYQDFGNFNYGAAGIVIFDGTTLLREAGRAQIAAGTSKPEWGYPGSRVNPLGGKPPYGDDPADQALIQKGIAYTQAGCDKR